MERLSDDFTLLIPTYNRPDRLARLLEFLGRERFGARVLVCDSSLPDGMERNRAAVKAAAVRLNVSLEAFDPATPVWTKFSAGADRVTTPFAALCADDDFVLPNAVHEIVEKMKADPCVALGHGWYFSFDESDVFELRDIVYRGPSLSDEDPVRRMYACARRYEALTYGIHRTEVMQLAFSRVKSMDTMLTKEVGSGMIAAIRGRVERYPILYHGRSAAPSQPYLGWHPLEMLAELPESLFATYMRYRQVITASLMDVTTEYSQSDLAGLVDLAHLRYLTDVLQPATLDRLFEHRIEATEKDTVMSDLFRLGSTQAAGGRLTAAAKRQFSALRARYGPHRLRDVHHGLPVRCTIEITASGQSRRYALFGAFVESLSDLNEGRDVSADLLAHINNYA